MNLIPLFFLSAPGLAWQACLKKTEVESELLTDIDIFLMIEKGITGGICNALHSYAKENNEYMKNYDKDIECNSNECSSAESSYLMYLDANNLYEGGMSEKLPVHGFKLVKNLSQFDKDFINNYIENSDKGNFLDVDVEYPKNVFFSS